MASDPSASQWKLSFSVIQLCPSLAANAVRGRRMESFRIGSAACQEADVIISRKDYLCKLLCKARDFRQTQQEKITKGGSKSVLFSEWQLQYRPSYQVVRQGSIAGNSQDLCEEDRIAIPPNPQIYDLLEKKTKHVSPINTNIHHYRWEQHWRHHTVPASMRKAPSLLSFSTESCSSLGWGMVRSLTFNAPWQFTKQHKCYSNTGTKMWMKRNQ